MKFVISNITYVTITLAGLVASWLILRYNLHMFQLNGYKNKEHWNRMKKAWSKQWSAFFILVVSLIMIGVAFLIDKVALNLLLIIPLIPIYIIYIFYIKNNTKKKLVFTARVKRLITTCVILTLAIDILAFIFIRNMFLPILCLVSSLEIFFPMISNIINAPVEKAISKHFYNDAKRMLEESPNLKIIGVTGSYGKTSVKFYLKTLLSAKYDVLVTPENFNTTLGVIRSIRENLKSTHEIFVCEMGARHVGDIKEICDLVHPDAGVITSIGPQHLETFFNMENIKKTKFELADALPEGGKLFLNADNENIMDFAPKYDSKTFYSTKPVSGGYYAKDIKVSNLGTDFTVVSPNGEEEAFQMKLIGEHNVINVVGAIAVANSFDIPLSDLKVPVRRLSPAPHRMEIKDMGAFTIIDDAYNSNPVGSRASVETLKMFDGVRILITPGMVELGDKEEEYNYKFGTYAANCVDYILLVGKKHTEPIYKGAIDSAFDSNKIFVFDKFEDAYKKALSISDSGHKYILLENDLPDNY